MKIHVTQDDIDKGVKLDCKKCSVSLAVLRQANADLVEATGLYIIIWGRGASPWKYNEYHTTRSVQRFMARFDAGKPVKPFSFILREVD